MEQALAFIERYGSSVVFVVVLLDQLGLPIPTVPMLLAFGALAGSDRLDPVLGLIVAIVASVCADAAWFLFGRWKGPGALSFLCRIALEPDTCVSKTRDLFARYGVKSLLVAKFVPGFDTVAPPLAGLLGVRVLPFLIWSAGGALLWLLAYAGLGYLFSGQLEAVVAAADRIGSMLSVVLVGLVAAYLAWKYRARQRVLRSIRMARISPDELHAMMLDGRHPVIVDARSRAALDELPFVIEGALHLTLEEIDARQHEIPREREVIVYCS